MPIAEFGRFGLLDTGEVVDRGFIYSDDPSDDPKIFADGKWVEFAGTYGELCESRSISEEEAVALTTGRKEP